MSLVSTELARGFFTTSATQEALLTSFVVQSLSRVRLFATSWTAAPQASLSLTISRGLPSFMSIASMMPSSPLILWCPLLLLPSIFPSIRDFSSELAVQIRRPKCWSFSFSISPSSEYSGLISFKIDWFDLLAAQARPSGVFSNTTVERHQFFGVLPSLRSSSHNSTCPLGSPVIVRRWLLHLMSWA